MKRAGLVSYAIVLSLVALGSIAIAAPSFRASLHAPPAASGTGATGSSGTGPTGGSGPIASPAPLAPGEEDLGVAPDFTACEGLTGLGNAMCRHEGLLVVHPENRGLQRSLERLEENRAEQEARKAERETTEAEGSDDHAGGGNGGGPHEPNVAGDPDAPPGPGNGSAHGNANGHGDDAGEG